MGRIRQNYVDTGLVRFAYRHIATLGRESVLAAEASECAADQDQFWAYHDYIFADQANAFNTLDEAALIAGAEAIGLNIADFETCLTSKRHTDLVELETRTAQQVGIRATPGFMVNDLVLIGAQPYDAFAQVINRALTDLGIEPPLPDEVIVSRGDDGLIEGLVTFPVGDLSDDILDGPGQNCGIYEERVDIDNILASLANGAVWIAYEPDLPADQVAALQKTISAANTASAEPKIILSPQGNLGGPIVATAWRVQLFLDDPADERLNEFLSQYQNGPYAPQSNEPCTGGVGQPITISN